MKFVNTFVLLSAFVLQVSSFNLAKVAGPIVPAAITGLRNMINSMDQHSNQNDWLTTEFISRYRFLYTFLEQLINVYLHEIESNTVFNQVICCRNSLIVDVEFILRGQSLTKTGSLFHRFQFTVSQVAVYLLLSSQIDAEH